MDSFQGFAVGYSHHLNLGYSPSSLAKDVNYQFPRPSNDYPLTLKPIAWWDNGPKYMAQDGALWIDRVGGYNFVQGNPSFRPVYTPNDQNGLPSLVFNGTSQFMIGPRMVHLQCAYQYTIWAVGKHEIIGNENNDDVGTGQNRTTFGHYKDNVVYNVTRSPQITNGVNSVTTSNIFNYCLTVFNGKNTTNTTKYITYFNGVQQVLTFTGTQATITENGQNCRLNIGRSGGIFVDSRCLEFGIINREISSSEITLLNSYLSSKYAL